MSFSAATCLTYTGTTPLSSTLDVYTSPDGITFTPNGTVSLSSIISGGCPYYFVVPDGTTIIRLYDTVSGCYVDIPIKNGDICTNCSFSLTNTPSTQIGTLSSGILTGACQSNITEYRINWYGPNDTTTFVFSTGSGNTFPHQYNHPFSGTSSIPLQEGTYYPVLENVIISGYSFSNTGGTGNILTDLDCLSPVFVDCYRCDNTTNTNTQYPYSAYNHHIQFLTTSLISPQPVSVTFRISGTTKFIPWSFKGEVVPDRYKISFSGQNYGGAIIGLEDYVVGNSVTSNNFNVSTFPKTAQTQYFFNKITTLTGLTVSDGDILILEVIPSSQNTNWDLYFSCLSTFNCIDCITDDSYYKIKASTLVPSVNCNTMTLPFLVSGCSINDFKNSNYFNYYTNPQPVVSSVLTSYGFPFNASFAASYFNNLAPNILTNVGLIYPSDYYTALNWGNSNCTFYTYYNGNESCSTRPTPTYYDRTFAPNGCGVLGYTGDSYFISLVYETYKYFVNNPISGYLYDPNSANTQYYAYFQMEFPKASNVDYCGDPTDFQNYIIHPSSVIETGTTGSDYYAKITANTISNGTSFTSCEINCSANTNNAIYSINNAATGGTVFYKSFSSGFYFLNQIKSYSGLKYNTTYLTANTRYGYYITYDTSYNTYPFSGGSNTLIPSLSATCCPNYTKGTNNPYFNSLSHRIYKYQYTIALTNPSDVLDFDISAHTITNGLPVGTADILVYRYSGGSVLYSDPTYII